MKLIEDMNLPPSLCKLLNSEGIEAIHWTEIGNPCATDEEVFNYARNNSCVILTHDLDFSVMLAHTHYKSPSVIQLRTYDVLSNEIVASIISVIKKHTDELMHGAIITIDLTKSRVRILPIN